MVRKTVSRAAKTAALLGFPAIAIAQSKGSGVPTIPTGARAEPSILSGSITIPGLSDNATSTSMTLSLRTLSSDGVASPASSVSCAIKRNTAVSSKGASPVYLPGFSYSCPLGIVNQSTVYSAALASGWGQVDSAYTLSTSEIRLAGLPSQAPSGTSNIRTYMLNLTVSKTGFSFDDKVAKTVECAEREAAAAFDYNITGNVYTVSSSKANTTVYPRPPGSFYITSIGNTSTRAAIAYYRSGWSFAVFGPMPGTVKFRTADSAKAAVTGSTDDLSKGWFDLGSLEDVNRWYCRAW